LSLCVEIQLQATSLQHLCLFAVSPDRRDFLAFAVDFPALIVGQAEIITYESEGGVSAF
jgi:hypothetical protein